MRRSSLKTGWRAVLAQGCLLVSVLVVASCSEDPPGGSSPGDDSGCSAGTQMCSGACVNTQTSGAHCGSCGAACVTGETCQAGRCTRTCILPQVDCGGSCVDPANNALHCGGCGRACAGGQICQNSACVTGGCPVGQTLCNGACVDTTTNASNCGTCGTACLIGQSCLSGVCTTSGTGGSGGGGGVGTGGTAGAGVSGSGGVATGGSAGAATGGTAGIGGGGSGGRGGAGGSSAGRGGTGGTGTGVGQSSTCPNITWPSSNGSRNLGSGITVTGVHDGGMQVHNGSLDNCAAGDQDSTEPLITVANGGTVRNVVMGNNVGDGIHCEGSCTIENVWFPYVCDDAITILGSGTVNIRNSGFKNARDKTIQHNGTATVNIQNVYVETAGKLYRSCGDGCSASSRRTANLTDIVAIGVDQVAGVSTNDTVTLRNICVYRTASICSIYEPGNSDEANVGVNSSNEGPSTNCNFGANDTHALLSRVTGIPFTTERVCGGPNGYKSGSTATACVTGFDKCLKTCMPGGYGFKEITCTNNRYAEGTGVICAMPTDSVAAQNLAPSRVMAATQEVANNASCSTEWAMGIDESNNAEYCLCVKKPGYYSSSTWLSWDCQRRWW
jgi:hypothetical protein